MASLKQIASELGVSFTLVSKVLSGKMGTSRVSEGARRAILQKAKELNYTPNRLAVALKAGRKAVIGIFFHQIGIPGSDISERLLHGFSDVLEEHGYRMMLRFFKTDEEFARACDLRLKREIDGLIIAGFFHPGLQDQLNELERENVPVLALTEANYRFRGGVTSVVVNSESQGYLATRHLLEQRCRRIACFATLSTRTNGFIKAHNDWKVKLDNRLIIPTEGWVTASGERSLQVLFDKKIAFDGIVCQSDGQANGAINGLTRRGIKIPEEVKITGVDNSPLTEDCIVPITSVTSEYRAAAVETVELLLQRIAGKKVKSVTLEPRLVVRRSSGDVETV